jgi:hypothetical protein
MVLAKTEARNELNPFRISTQYMLLPSGKEKKPGSHCMPTLQKQKSNPPPTRKLIARPEVMPGRKRAGRLIVYAPWDLVRISTCLAIIIHA